MDEQSLTSRHRDPQEAHVQSSGLVRLGTLDARGVSARIEVVDGDAVLLVDDGDVEIEFSSGAGGSWRDAIAGAHEIAAVALAFADELSRQGPPSSRS